MRRSAGFTLIEMLVLIIIMVVLSTAVVPVFSRLRDRSAFDAYMGDVVGFFAQMRALAVEQGGAVEVRYDAQSDSFSARAESGDLSGDMPTDAADSAETAPTVFERTFTLPEDFAISDVQVFGPDAYLTGAAAPSEVLIRFYEDGTSDGIRFTVERKTGQMAIVTVWPSTGLAEVESAAVSSSAGYSASWMR
ncbi:MAG: hypothetical protein GX446_09935 [Chthonomonadales bacterium]|nr:hypothetical protein [Chthonomonadales bacterium]